MSEDRAMSAPDREKLRALADRYARTLAIFEDTDVFGMQRHYVEEEIGAAVAPLLSAILDALEVAAPHAATEPRPSHEALEDAYLSGKLDGEGEAREHLGPPLTRERLAAALRVIGGLDPDDDARHDFGDFPGPLQRVTEHADTILEALATPTSAPEPGS